MKRSTTIFAGIVVAALLPLYLAMSPQMHFLHGKAAGTSAPKKPIHVLAADGVHVVDDFSAMGTLEGIDMVFMNPQTQATIASSCPSAQGCVAFSSASNKPYLINADASVTSVPSMALANTWNAAQTLAPTARSSGAPSDLTVTGPADTALTASTESNSVLFNLSATRQWATGALATQREVYIQAPTYGFVGASTVTDAATVDISGAPIAGTNTTLTRSHALRVEGGQSSFGGAVLVGTTAATATAGSGITVAPAARTTGSPSLLTVTAPADTTLTASTESNSVNLNLSATRQFATGAITSQREVYIQAPTYSFVGASTITTAATVAISGAPTAGTNATLTNSYALWVAGGASLMAGQLSINNGTAVPAGGSAAAALLMSSTAGLGVYFGSGAPTVSAAQGSVYIRTDGSSTSTRLYINSTGSTTWVAVTTAS